MRFCKLARQYGQALTVDFLSCLVVPVNSQADLGATPLMVACAARHLDVAEMLLDAGADPDLATPDGWRALHVAVRACAAPIVRLLLAEGRANPDAMSRLYLLKILFLE